MEHVRDKEDEHEDGHMVEVTVDSQEKEIRKGPWVVGEFKEAVGVAADRALDQVVDGELKPLDDSAKIHIKGGEVFISHVRQGGSS